MTIMKSTGIERQLLSHIIVNQLRRVLFIVFLCLMFMLLPAGSAVCSDRVALIIGNKAYADSPLKNSANDANDIAASLKKYGFHIIKKINANQRQMDEAIDEFYRLLLDAEIGLFYYAGHGMQVDGANYLIPVKSSIRSQSDVKYKAINSNLILGKMEDAQSKLNIVILDACRNNPFRSFFRSTQKGLAFMSAPNGTIIAYATAPGEVARDGDGRNGIYTEHLLRNLEKPGYTVIELFNQTALDVKRATNSMQSPWTYNTGLEPYALSEYQRKKPQSTLEYPAKKANLIVRSNVYGDSVSIDGEFVGSTKIDRMIAAGPHVIVVSKGGYRDWRQEITLAPGESRTIKAELSNITTSPANSHEKMTSSWRKAVASKSATVESPPAVTSKSEPVTSTPVNQAEYRKKMLKMWKEKANGQ